MSLIPRKCCPLGMAAFDAMDAAQRRWWLPGPKSIVAFVALGCGSPQGGPVTETGWSFRRIDDCPSSDPVVGGSIGSDVPPAAGCTTMRNGIVAVCWDQVVNVNPTISGPGCNYYATVPGLFCEGGPHPGRLYVCSQP
jgi:hypothetical protein